MENAAKVAIIGVGNILFRDDGLGIYASQFLAENYDFSPGVDVIDGGTLGMNLLSYFQRYERVIVLDALSVSDDSPPGTVYSMPASELQAMGACRQTAHEVEVLQTLEMGALVGGMAEIQIIAMVPEDIDSVAIGLTEAVENTLLHLIETGKEQLRQWHIAVTSKPSSHGLAEILENYQTLNQFKTTACL
ncbi:Ni/Fe hydrogenase [Hydrogenovibrio sp. SC-1]|uniref:HyaD/HybD family hydrogenase maturation endopeptidase n=1 Tax=Hydrogenovibrio sp. SC-1 TaxID=2065820 RepID=UPI000C7DCC37|nr:HyaD/HybD family hydrogenase maturation endopeptidase [Hydrogenovibrio sp. SC-1]PLA74534.1 Ni/Fe hydrogenase [Hydrogenovibrio sp. SC-1]